MSEVWLLIGIAIGIAIGYAVALAANYFEYWSKTRQRMEMDESLQRLQEWQRR